MSQQVDNEEMTKFADAMKSFASAMRSKIETEMSRLSAEQLAEARSKFNAIGLNDKINELKVTLSKLKDNA